jgi:hypothetical protein
VLYLTRNNLIQLFDQADLFPVSNVITSDCILVANAARESTNSRLLSNKSMRLNAASVLGAKPTVEGLPQFSRRRGRFGMFSLMQVSDKVLPCSILCRVASAHAIKYWFALKTR